MSFFSKKKPAQPVKEGPLMRNAHFTKSLKGVYTAVAAAGVTATLFYLLHNRRRMNIYQEFYENYDPEVSFNRMMEGGYLDSCPPGGGEEESDDGKKK